MESFLSKFKQAPSSTSALSETQSQSQADDRKQKRLLITPWVEKYRPAKIDEVVYQSEVVAMLKSCLQTNDLPNLLFYGPPGTGKTSTIIALAKEMFGTELYKSRVLELNASDERGIGVIREKVKKFAQMTASARVSGKKTIPGVKLIILDEADSMTNHAQAALRRTMEKESRTTRFCLICNYVSRIIEPIASRCTIFRFKALDSQLVVDKLKQIASDESVKTEENVLQELVNLSDGDLRRAITLLQSASNLKGKDVRIQIDDVREIAGYIPNNVVQELIALCSEPSTSYEKLSQSVSNIVAEGYSASQLMIQLHEWLIESTSLNDEQKSKISQHLALTDQRLLDGADEWMQIIDAATVISKNSS